MKFGLNWAILKKSVKPALLGQYLHDDV
jgi:hypothetical protein